MFLKNTKIAQKLFYGFGIVTMLMLFVLAYTYVNFSKQSDAIKLNIESYNIIREADQMLINLVNMETGSRGFALTGKEEFLEPFNKGQVEYLRQFNQLKSLTKESLVNQGRLEEIQEEYKTWSTYQNEKIIEARRRINSGHLSMDDLVFEARKGIAKQHMDKMRAILNEMTNEEEGLLNIRRENLERMQRKTFVFILIGGTVSAVIASIIALLVIRMVVEPVKTVTNTFKEISEGDVELGVRLKVNSNDELGSMSKYFNRFMEKLKELITENKIQSWLKTGQAELSEEVRGEEDISMLSSRIIAYITKYTGAQIGAFYTRTDDNSFKMVGSYAYKRRKSLSNEFKVGEGIIGQAVLEKQSVIISNLPEDYVIIGSGTGEAPPKNILVVPCMSNDEVVCVIELGAFNELTNEQLQFVELVSESIAITINSVKSQVKMRELLSKTLEQSEELQAQQEELRQSNEELLDQASALRESEAQMQTQQEELRVINEELEERTKSLEIQAEEIQAKNWELNRVREEIENKAQALEKTNKYKSEFLANMSHELRTPLNSIIVLSQMLAESKDNSSLTDKQLQYASTIHSSGEDLLKLINDILDLSKVEAGKLDINYEPVNLRQLVEHASRSFTAIAEQKELLFEINFEGEFPITIESDSQRILQIINNLLSNAFKFTHKGSIKVAVRQIMSHDTLRELGFGKKWIGISVTDSGIGISPEKHEIIFDAFKQSDGTTSRKYGGTGLGLSISRELAALLGGKIKVESIEGIGSTFTLFLPEIRDTGKQIIQNSMDEVGYIASTVADSRVMEVGSAEVKDQVLNKGEEIIRSSKMILIIEDDIKFSEILNDLAKERGYTTLVADNGTDGLKIAKEFKPDAVLLDIGLPDISGLKVLEKLRENPETRDIPVHIVSGREQQEFHHNIKGILGYLRKPVKIEELEELFNKTELFMSRRFRKLLVVDGGKDCSISEVLSSNDIQVIKVDKGEQAIKLLKDQYFDCMVLEYNLDDMSALDLLEKIRFEDVCNIPIIICTEKELSKQEEEELQKYSESIIVKAGDYLDRLEAEAYLFLHKIDSNMKRKATKTLEISEKKEDSIKGKTVLVVDDDMRNVFALTSILEENGLKVIVGRSGTEAIEKLHKSEKVDIVLMDIMMPEMDGYAAMREIRKEERFSKLPIIAITAKAMKEDRINCIDAGANDYITKPINMEHIISLLKVWLYK